MHKFNMEELIQDCYNDTKNLDTGGKVADYIPQLASVNPELYGVAFCDKSGNIVGLGDCDKQFCLQSTVKPLNYCLARLEESADSIDQNALVHNHVGFEPSGVKFNAFVLNDQGLPHNPLINSGAIMTASLIGAQMEPSHRFQLVQHFIGRLSGLGEAAIGFDNSVYLSEKMHADRNISLAYYMRENKAYQGNPTQSELMEHLDLYFQTCSLTCNAKTMAAIAATLAFHGKSPVSGENIVRPEVVMDCLSIMYMCGMYDFSGQFAFHVGLPCKSGVSGALLLVIPNVGGLCIWSPPLDSLGNSSKGLAFLNTLTVRTNSALHIFRCALKPGVVDEEGDEDELAGIRSIDALAMRLIHTSATGDFETFKKLTEFGANTFSKPNENRQETIKRILEIGDYDKRTSLHLAAAEGHADIVYFLSVEVKVDQKQDRWGVTPLHEVRKHVKQIKRSDREALRNYKQIMEHLSGKVIDDKQFEAFVKQGHEKVHTKSFKDSSQHSIASTDDYNMSFVPSLSLHGMQFGSSTSQEPVKAIAVESTHSISKAAVLET